jgi:hypothetical protein
MAKINLKSQKQSLHSENINALPYFYRAYPINLNRESNLGEVFYGQKLETPPKRIEIIFPIFLEKKTILAF